jgi:uridine kinase
MPLKIFGICGGSCSGKTTLAKRLYNSLGPSRACLIFQDNFYIDQSSKFKSDGEEINFDHPKAIDFDLMASVLRDLKLGKSVELPQYDFKTHTRKKETVKITPPSHKDAIIFVDGIHILSQKVVRDLLDDSVFLEILEDIRFSRRKKRDTEERGRTVEGVSKQFFNHVKPMHDQYVEPSKIWAKRILTTQKDVDSCWNSI